MTAGRLNGIASGVNLSAMNQQCCRCVRRGQSPCSNSRVLRPHPAARADRTERRFRIAAASSRSNSNRIHIRHPGLVLASDRPRPPERLNRLGKRSHCISRPPGKKPSVETTAKTTRRRLTHSLNASLSAEPSPSDSEVCHHFLEVCGKAL